MFSRYIIVSSVNNDDLISFLIDLLSPFIYFITLSRKLLNKNGSSHDFLLLIFQDSYCVPINIILLLF